MDNIFLTLSVILQKGGKLNEKASLILTAISQSDVSQSSSTYLFLSLLSQLQPEKSKPSQSKRKQHVSQDSINFKDIVVDQTKLDAILLLLHLVISRVNPAILQKFVLDIKNRLVLIIQNIKDETVIKYSITILSQIFQLYPENSFMIQEN